MFWWPFGRKRKRSKKETLVPAEEPPLIPTDEKQSYPQSTQSAGAAPRDPFADVAPASPPPPRASYPDEKRPVREPPRHQHPAQRNTSAENITALPVQEEVELEENPRLRDPRDAPTRSATRSRRSNESRQLRRKPSRNPQDVRDRLDEVSGSAPIPTPARVGTDPNRRSGVPPPPHSLQHQDSTISLPAPRSVRSSMTGEPHRWDIGALDVLSARPKIRYSLHQSNPASGSTTSQYPFSRSDSRRQTRPVSRRTLKEGKTVDELADDYDATTIRELMERDAKRVEKKRRADEEKARRRLERAARREAEARGEQPADPGEESSRAYAGLGLRGLNAGPSSPVESRIPRDPRPQNEQSNHFERSAIVRPQNPFADAESEVVTPLEEPIVREAKALQMTTHDTPPPSSPKSPLQHQRKTSNLSQTTDPRNRSTQDLTQTTTAETDRRASEISTRRGGALAALFRRSKRASEDNSRPMSSDVSFSNTSRESFARQPIPAHLREQIPTPAPVSGMPTRTKSKFKEDLPERLSTDMLRTKAMEAPMPAIDIKQKDRIAATPLDISQSEQQRTESPLGVQLSQSLASVDSEGSWLSGSRPPRKRTSLQAVSSPSALTERPEAFKASYEDMALADEDYFKKRPIPRKRTSEIAQSVPEDDDTILTEEPEESPVREVARQATIVHRQRPSGEISSPTKYTFGRELTSARDEISSPNRTETDPSEVRLVSHARQVSSGSAKLLDIPARKDSKRTSTISQPD